MSAKNKEPKTRREWQECVNLAEVYLLLDSARAYGLVRGGPEVDVDRCSEMLAVGEERGIRPQQAAVKRLARILFKVRPPMAAT